MIEQTELTWVPEINSKRCKGCGSCIEICPEHAIRKKYIDPEVR